MASLFSQYGEVKTAKVITDKMSGRSKGFGFVEMEDDSAMDAINALNGHELEGRPMRVSEARPKEEGGGGRSFGGGDGGERRGGGDRGFGGSGGGNGGGRGGRSGGRPPRDRDSY